VGNPSFCQGAAVESRNFDSFSIVDPWLNQLKVTHDSLLSTLSLWSLLDAKKRNELAHQPSTC
jgi:hypothetical protein